MTRLRRLFSCPSSRALYRTSHPLGWYPVEMNCSTFARIASLRFDNYAPPTRSLEMGRWTSPISFEIDNCAEDEHTQLDQVAHRPHDQQSNTDSLAQTQVLGLVRCDSLVFCHPVSLSSSCETLRNRIAGSRKHTLGATAHELNAILSKVRGRLEKLLNLVAGHRELL